MKDDIIHKLASKEIHSIMGSKDLGARPVLSGKSGKLLSLKGTEYYKVRYKNDHQNFLASHPHTNRIISRYPEESIVRDVAYQEDMWDAAICLHRAIVSSESRLPKHRQNRFIHNLFEAFYNVESKRCISRPNFFTCMMKLFKQMATDDPTHSIGIGLEALYDKFDVLGNDSLNWRQFLFYLHLVANPTLDCRQQLLNAFVFIASHDGIDCSTSAKGSIDIHDIATVLYPLVRADSLHKAVSFIDEAWSNVTNVGSWSGSRVASTKLTFHMFKQMLNDESMTSLLGQSTSIWGRFRSFPVIFSPWEEEFYNERLIRLVRDERILVSICNKLQRDDNRMKHTFWKEWKAYTLHQQSLRTILNSIDAKIMDGMKYRGLCAFLQWTRRTVAVLTLQRVCRGYSGRKIAHDRWNINQSATAIQCRVRMFFSKQRLASLSFEYNVAITTIQRIIRGALGRRIAYKRLMSLVEQKHMDNMKEKERLLNFRGIWSITMLQSCFRRTNAIAQANELRAMRQRENDIRHAMEARIEKFRKERKVYKRQLEEYYRSKKEDHLRNTNIQAKIAKDKICIRTLRRRLTNDDLKNAPSDETEALQTQEWKRDWEIKIENGVASIKEHCAHCLRCPDNQAEKKISASLKKRIKARTKLVLQRADSRGIPMETKQATQIGTAEMLHIIGEEERERLLEEMQKAGDQKKKDKEEARLQDEARKEQERTRATVFAVSVVARACRSWLARRQLRRKCIEIYEKDFDEHSHTFYYRNKKTGETSWVKPKAMGSFEMAAKDEWKVLRDAHSFPYYYNPHSMTMQWNPPINELMCSCQVPHHWCREFPVRQGPCPNFSVHEVNGCSYCRECLDALYTSRINTTVNDA